MLDAGQSIAAMYQARLKQSSSSSTAPAPGFHLTALECTYSCYLVTVSHFVCNSTRITGTRKTTQALTTQQIIEEYAGASAGTHSTCHSVASSCSTRSQSASTTASEGDAAELMRNLSASGSALRFEHHTHPNHTFKIENPDSEPDSTQDYGSDSMLDSGRASSEVDFMNTPRVMTHYPGRPSLDMITFEPEMNCSYDELKVDVGIGEEISLISGKEESNADTAVTMGDVTMEGSDSSEVAQGIHGGEGIHREGDEEEGESERVEEEEEVGQEGRETTEGVEGEGLEQTEGGGKEGGEQREGVLDAFSLLSMPLDISRVKNGHHSQSNTHHTHHSHHTHDRRRRTGSLSAEDEAINLAAAKLGLKVCILM